MNTKFLKDLDAAFEGETTSRRDALRQAGRLGGAAALAVTPLFAMAESAFAAKTGAPVNFARNPDVLNYALTLEYLEYYFYRRAAGYTIPGEGDDEDQNVPPEVMFPSDDVAALFEEIRDNELAHVNFLTAAVQGEGATPVVFEQDDFTFELGGASIFADYAVFLTVAQGLEDTGVRAYKGKVGELQGTPLLTPAVQIHSVEARHAAAVRRLRGNQGWIPFSQPGVNPAIAAVYGPGGPFPSESNTTQGGVELVGALPGYTEEQITEAFDEALDEPTVLSIASQFIAG